MAVKRSTTAAASPSNASANQVPPGTPAWITADLIEHTLRIWQPRYPTPLTPDDAVYIILNAGRLLDVLSRGEK